MSEPTDANLRKPWERSKGESKQAYQAFSAYRDAGLSRNVGGVARGLAKSEQLLYAWLKKWSWNERAEAYDLYMERLAMDSVEQVTREEAAKWARRRTEYRDEVWKLAIKSLERIAQMLQFPVMERETWEESVDGKTVMHTVIKPGKWNMGTIGQLLAQIDKPARLAAEMDTERASMTILRREAETVARAYGVPVEQVMAEAEKAFSETWRGEGQQP